MGSALRVAAEKPAKGCSAHGSAIAVGAAAKQSRRRCFPVVPAIHHGKELLRAAAIAPVRLLHEALCKQAGQRILVYPAVAFNTSTTESAMCVSSVQRHGP